MSTAAWLALEAGLNALFTRIATVPGVVPSVSGSAGPSQVGAAQAQIGFVAPDNPVELSWTLTRVKGIARGELREDYLPGTFDGGTLAIAGDTYEPDPAQPTLRLGGVVASVHTHTSVTVEVKIESHEQTNPASGHWRALMARMRLPSVNEELTALGLAFVDASELFDDVYDDEHGRVVSVFVGSLRFNGAEYAEDLPITTIETSEIEPTVVT